MRLIPVTIIWPVITGVVIVVGLLIALYHGVILLIISFSTSLAMRDVITRDLFNRLLKGIKP